MTKKETQLVAHLLKMAADEFDNHGCNEFDFADEVGWTAEEAKRFIKKTNPDYYNEVISDSCGEHNFCDYFDSALMDYFAEMFKNKAAKMK